MVITLSLVVRFRESGIKSNITANHKIINQTNNKNRYYE